MKPSKTSLYTNAAFLCRIMNSDLCTCCEGLVCGTGERNFYKDSWSPVPCYSGWTIRQITATGQAQTDFGERQTDGQQTRCTINNAVASRSKYHKPESISLSSTASQHPFATSRHTKITERSRYVHCTLCGVKLQFAACADVEFHPIKNSWQNRAGSSILNFRLESSAS